jgi:hypothetical protein
MFFMDASSSISLRKRHQRDGALKMLCIMRPAPYPRSGCQAATACSFCTCAGGRNEYLDRSHVDGSALIRFSREQKSFRICVLCGLECCKKPVPPAAMFKLIRRFLSGAPPLFLLLSTASFHFFFGTPPLFLRVGPLGFPRTANNRSGNRNRTNNSPILQDVCIK